jgi:hypothetical protein
MIVEKMIKNNESRSSLVSTQRSFENSQASQDFSKSSSNVKNLKNKALSTLSPKAYSIHTFSETERKAPKPPLAPGINVIARNTEMQNMRISEEEIIHEESERSESNYDNVQDDSLEKGKHIHFNA